MFWSKHRYIIENYFVDLIWYCTRSFPFSLAPKPLHQDPSKFDVKLWSATVLHRVYTIFILKLYITTIILFCHMKNGITKVLLKNNCSTTVFKSRKKIDTTEWLTFQHIQKKLTPLTFMGKSQKAYILDWCSFSPISNDDLLWVTKSRKYLVCLCCHTSSTT